LLGSLDCFHVLGWISLAGIVLALASKAYKSPGAAAGH
jgi:hypothetical protein